MRKGTRFLSLLLAAVLLISGCSTSSEETQGSGTQAETTAAAQTQESSSSAVYTPGVYESVQEGFGGEIVVTMTFDENGITDVQVVGDDEVHLFMNLTAKIEKGKRSDK